MHVTFSFAFSSRYAKTRTPNFRKVVRQHTDGVAGSIIWIVLEIYLSFHQWKFWKSVKNWRSYYHEFGYFYFTNFVCVKPC